jgi:AcrR family transcriptional regulator
MFLAGVIALDSIVIYRLGMTVTSAPVGQLDSSRGERTRAAILDASRALFLERGFAGTPINAITEACGISRAGFYTYFKDKREIFNVLGKTAYHEALAVIAEWADAREPFGPTDIQHWVGRYFDYMDHHGAFVLASAHSAPDDDDFRNSRNRMVTRASWKLGQAIAGDGVHSPDVIGVAVMGLLDRAWYTVHRQTVAVDREEMIAVVAEMIVAMTQSAS